MWNKESQPEAPGSSPSAGSPSSNTRIPGTAANATNAPAQPNARPGTPVPPAARTLAVLGATIVVKGEIASDEDLQIDGKVDGPILLQGNRLTVGRTAQLNSEISAREVIVYGTATGNIHSRDRVEIKKDGRVVGDITTTRISIEDGGYFKGRIEIEQGHSNHRENRESKEAEVPAGAAAY